MIRDSEENGNVAFYVLFVLPVAIALLMIIVDISSWQSLREEAQSEADRISLQIAGHLPFASAARSAFAQSASEFNARAASKGSSLRVLEEDPDAFAGGAFVGESRVRVVITGAHASMIDFFLRAFTNQEMVLQVRQESEARLVPLDSVLILSDGISLRPSVPPNLADFSSGDIGYASFGGEFDWAPSEYFTLAPPPLIKPSPEPAPPFGWTDWWKPAQFSLPEFRRWVTQTCYNPANMPLKLSGIMIADTIQASPLNRIAVMGTPGDQPGVAPYSFIKGISANDLPFWSNYFESPSGICDEACVYYSHFSSRYALPESFSEHSRECDELFSTNPLTDPNGHYPNPFQSKLSDCFLQRNISLREALYYRAVRGNSHEPDFSNISRTARAGASLLIEEEKLSVETSAVSRGNLAGSASRIVFLLVDALPDIAETEMQEVLEILEHDERLRMYVLAYVHPGLTEDAGALLQARSLQYDLIPGISSFFVDESSIFQVVQSILAKERKVVLAS